ncbi:hypothetical protein N4G58_17315 [Edwardsiella piscicida]|nr:hypothetical protein N4G58_17315 [Edwardsiella piscicida]
MKAVRSGKIRRQEEQASFVSWRFALLCGCILLALLGLLARAAYLQVISPEHLVREGMPAPCVRKRSRPRAA